MFYVLNNKLLYAILLKQKVNIMKTIKDIVKCYMTNQVEIVND